MYAYFAGHVRSLSAAVRPWGQLDVWGDLRLLAQRHGSAHDEKSNFLTGVRNKRLEQIAKITRNAHFVANGCRDESEERSIIVFFVKPPAALQNW